MFLYAHWPFLDNFPKLHMKAVAKKSLLVYTFDLLFVPILPKFTGAIIDAKSVDNRYILGKK